MQEEADPRIEVPDIELQHVGPAAHPALVFCQGGMRPLAHPAGIAVVDEGGFRSRFQDLDDRVVEHPVAVGAAAMRRGLGSRIPNSV